MNAADDSPLPPHNEALRCLEAFLFTSPQPVPLSQLKALLQDFDKDSETNPDTPPPDAKALLTELQTHYATRGVNLIESGSSWAFRSDPALKDHLVPHRKIVRRISRPALETLAIIAYRQPITRPEIEAIRNISTLRGVLTTLMEHKWIAPGARRAIPGRPLTWRTTDAFLDHFGLTSLRDLPNARDLPLDLPSEPLSGAGGEEEGGDERDE